MRVVVRSVHQLSTVKLRSVHAVEFVPCVSAAVSVSAVQQRGFLLWSVLVLFMNTQYSVLQKISVLETNLWKVIKVNLEDDVYQSIHGLVNKLEKQLSV